MPSNRTKNYNLSQWEKSDKVLMDDFNKDNEKIDAAIKAVDVRVDGKADRSALDALSRTVDGKADVSSHTSLSQTVANLTASLNKKGNCHVVLQTYTGTGDFGRDNPTMRTFPAKPLVAIFFDAETGSRIVAFYGATGGRNTEQYAVGVVSSGNSIGIWHSSAAGTQMNAKGKTYYALALIAADA